jgi:dienelactone hydrolase
MSTTKRVRKNVIIVLSLVIFATWLVGSAASAVESVSFKGTTKIANGDFVTLTGKLIKPQGDGPFPAVVLLHGCGGILKAYDDWAEKLASWGYVALEVDSLGPRSLTSICANIWQVNFSVRAEDAYDAKAYLNGLPFVDSKRIGIMGWSHGGCGTLAAVSRQNYGTFAAFAGTNLEPPKRNGLFKAAVAFYPFCIGQLEDSNAPLLVLIGEQDTWCPALLCQMKMPSGKTSNEVALKIYPEAYHGFDMVGVDVVVGKHRVAYNPAAFSDSIGQVKEFLAKYMK